MMMIYWYLFFCDQVKWLKLSFFGLQNQYLLVQNLFSGFSVFFLSVKVCFFPLQVIINVKFKGLRMRTIYWCETWDELIDGKALICFCWRLRAECNVMCSSRRLKSRRNISCLMYDMFALISKNLLCKCDSTCYVVNCTGVPGEN